MIKLPCAKCGHSFELRLDALAPFSCPNCSSVLQLSLTGVEGATLPPASVSEFATIPPSSGDSAPTLMGGKAIPASASSVVPGYEILGELGRGGMGVVYRARHKALNREVALKMILAGVHAGSDELARFRLEAEAIARLQHPGIVQVFEIGEHDGKPFFALEFCSGGSLEKKLAGTPLKPEDASALVEKLARAMHAAHEARVIHRDLKPANVLLSSDGTPKVTDFGLAKKLDEAGQTQTGNVMGTPSYMAPEQAEGRKDIGPGADVYALGAILYECLTGRPPFRAATSIDTIMQVLTQEPVPLTQLNAGVPRDLETICLKCLRKEPGKRYATAAELAEDLRRFLCGEAIQARPVGRVERAVKWVRRNRVVTALAAGVFVVLAAGVVVSVWFALDAREEAKRADEQVIRADSKTEEARKSATLAAKREKEANEALDDVERALLEGLLGLIGWKQAIDEAEWGALRKLGSLKNDRSRIRFVEMGLSEAASARRLGNRAEWVVQAIVGLNANRRAKVVDAVLKRWREKKLPTEVSIACIEFSIALNITDRRFAREAALFIADRYIITHPQLLVRLVDKLDRSITRTIAAKLPLSISRSPVPSSEWEHYCNAVECAVLVIERLNRKDANGYAVAASKQLVAYLTKGNKFRRLGVEDALIAWLSRISFQMSDEAVESLVDSIIASLSAVKDENDHIAGTPVRLVRMLGSMSSRTSVASATKAAKAIAALMNTDPNLYDEKRLRLTKVLVSFIRRIDAKSARQHASKAAQGYVDALQQANGSEDEEQKPITESVSRRLSGGLQALLSHLERVEARRHAGNAVAAHAHSLCSRDVEDGEGDPIFDLRAGEVSDMIAFQQWLDLKLIGQYASKVADAFVISIGKTQYQELLNDRVNGLARLIQCLDAVKAKSVSSKAVNSVVRFMIKHPGCDAPIGFAKLSSRIDSVEAEKSADTLFAAMESTSDLRRLSALATAWSHLSAGIPALKQKKQASKLAKNLFLAIKKKGGYSDDCHWVTGFAPVSRAIDASEVRKLYLADMKFIVAAMRKAQHPLTDIFLAWRFIDLLDKLDVSEGSTHAAQAADVLIDSVSTVHDAYRLSLPAEALTMVSRRLSTSKLIRLLAHPLAAGSAQRALLDVLGIRTKRRFHNTWHFIDWAHSNGVDFTSALKKNPQPAR